MVKIQEIASGDENISAFALRKMKQKQEQALIETAGHSPARYNGTKSADLLFGDGGGLGTDNDVMVSDSQNDSDDQFVPSALSYIPSSLLSERKRKRDTTKSKTQGGRGGINKPLLMASTETELAESANQVLQWAEQSGALAKAKSQRVKPKPKGQVKVEIDHQSNGGGGTTNGLQKKNGESKQRKKSSKKIKRDKDVDNQDSESIEDDSEKVAAAELKWLLEPIGVEVFLNEYCEKQVLYIDRSNARAHYQNLFGQQQMVDIIDQNYVEWGLNVNAAKYVNDRRLTLNGTGKVFNHILREKYEDGCSIQLTNPQAFSDTVWECCDRLQELFCCFVGANSYLTPANTQGFAPHWDDVDAFIIQLEGSKYWRVYEPSTEQTTLPRESSANFRQCDLEENKLCWEGWLKPSDLLYMPRGFIHQGYTNETEHSLHLTISFSRKNTYADLMEKLLPQVLSAVVDGSFQARHALPEGYMSYMGVGVNAEGYMSYMGVGVNAQLKHDAAQAFADTINDTMDHVHHRMMTMCDAGADMMATQFMQQALPPKLTDEEKSMSVFGNVEGLISETRTEGAKKPFTLNTQIKLLRKHAQRLVFEAEDKAYLLHRMHNSRVFEQRPAAVVDLLDYMIEPVQQLIDTYPKPMSIKQFSAGAKEQKLHLAQTLWDAGLIRKC